MRHRRAVVLMLKIIGIIVIVFAALGLVIGLMGLIMDRESSSVIYIFKIIKSAIGIAIGIGMNIASKIIKEKNPL